MQLNLLPKSGGELTNRIYNPIQLDPFWIHPKIHIKIRQQTASEGRHAHPPAVLTHTHSLMCSRRLYSLSCRAGSLVPICRQKNTRAGRVLVVILLCIV